MLHRMQSDHRHHQPRPQQGRLDSSPGHGSHAALVLSLLSQPAKSVSPPHPTSRPGCRPCCRSCCGEKNDGIFVTYMAFSKGRGASSSAMCQSPYRMVFSLNRVPTLYRADRLPQTPHGLSQNRCLHGHPQSPKAKHVKVRAVPTHMHYPAAS